MFMDFWPNSENDISKNLLQNQEHDYCKNSETVLCIVSQTMGDDFLGGREPMSGYYDKI